jgi:hypothetical protein
VAPIASEVSTDFRNEDRVVQMGDWQPIPIIPIIPKGFRKRRTNSIKSVSLLIIVEMFADYKSLVIGDYQKKKAANALPLRLIQATPANLKRECKAVCDERYHRKDEKTLREFFGQGGDKVAWLQAIKRCDTDKFRPLGNFLKGLTDWTEDKNIELLAWLIDFEPRPFELGRRYNSNTSEAPENKPDETPINGENEKGLVDQPSQPVSPEHSDQLDTPPASGLKTRKTIGILAAMLFVSVAISIYWLAANKAPAIVFAGPQACMFWAGDHYQQVSCNQKFDDTMVIALDSEKVNHFKKITQPDTITEKSKGTVWYVKYNGNMEYYTSSGYHPIDPRLRLKPITDYIIRKYIHNN